MSYAQYKTIGKDPNSVPVESQAQVPHVKTLEERKSVIEQYPLVCIDYYTDWCGPCKTCAPQFAQLAQKYEAKGVAFLKEDAEMNLGGCPKIRGVPTFHFYYKGKILEDLTVVGADIDQVEEHIAGIIQAAQDSKSKKKVEIVEEK